MFYRLRDDAEARRRGLRLAVIGSQPDIDLPWRMGIRFRDPVPVPIRCTLAARGGPDLPDAFLSKRIPLFSTRLVDALRAAGVDNLDCYDADVRSPDGESLVARYYATNIVGKIQCVDLGASQFDPQSEFPMLEFSRVVIDDSKVGGTRLFRLAENPSWIVADAEVARAVEPLGLIGIMFEPLNGAAGS